MTYSVPKIRKGKATTNDFKVSTPFSFENSKDLQLILEIFPMETRPKM
jgi:hypothetical protein